MGTTIPARPPAPRGPPKRGHAPRWRDTPPSRGTYARRAAVPPVPPQGRVGAPPWAVALRIRRADGRFLPPGGWTPSGSPSGFLKVYFPLSAHVLLFSQYPVVLHPPLLPGEKDAIQHPRGRLRRSEQQAGTCATGRLRHSRTREQTPQTPTRQVTLGLHRQRLAPDQKSPAISRLASIKAPPIMGGRPTRMRQERNNPLKRRIT